VPFAAVYVLAVAVVPAAMGYIASLLAFGSLLRCCDIALARAPDPAMLSHGAWIRMVFLTGPETRYPRTKDEAHRNRLHALGQILEGVLIIASFAALATIRQLYGAGVAEWSLASSSWLAHLFWLAYFYLKSQIWIGLFNPLLMLVSGVWCQRSFDAPVLAASPGELWSRRWNTTFRNAMHRHIFNPFRQAFGKSTLSTSLAVLCVFAFSGVVHEVFILAGARSLATFRRYAGYNTAFFMAQGVVSLAVTQLSRLWHSPLPSVWVRRLLTWLWFLATSPLFIIPLIGISQEVNTI
jgi:hypothetical protein